MDDQGKALQGKGCKNRVSAVGCFRNACRFTCVKMGLGVQCRGLHKSRIGFSGAAC